MVAKTQFVTKRNCQHLHKANKSIDTINANEQMADVICELNNEKNAMAARSGLQFAAIKLL